jgi:hypothetical protein
MGELPQRLKSISGAAMRLPAFEVDDAAATVYITNVAVIS